MPSSSIHPLRESNRSIARQIKSSASGRALHWPIAVQQLSISYPRGDSTFFEWASVEMTRADLGSAQLQAFGPSDGFVPGKYRNARLFVFQTPSWHVWNTCEAGDYGSSWFASPRSEPLSAPKRSLSYLTFPGVTPELFELSNFMVDWAQAIHAAKPSYFDPGFASHPLFLSVIEAQTLSAEISDTVASPRSRKPRV